MKTTQHNQISPKKVLETQNQKRAITEYSNYLFDADGTLIDTEEIIFRTYYDTCIKFGNIKLEREEVTSLIGLPLRVQMEQYLGTLSDEYYNTVVNHFRNYQSQIYKQFLTAFPAVKETLLQLKQKGKILGIVTSRNLNFLKKYMDELKLTDYFDILVTPECTEKHKPHPEPVEYAVKSLNLKKSETIFIGDARFDIESGNAAGVSTAWVAWSPNNPQNFPIQPDYILKNMEDLLS